MTAGSDRTEPADLAVHAAWVIPVEPDAQVLEQHCVVTRGGRIVALLPSQDARRRYTARESVELPTHALLPGLVNAHAHAPTSLLRGLADGRQSVPEHTSCAEAGWASAEFVRDGSELAIACMLRSGTTCFGDTYYFPNVTAEAVQRQGMRASLGMIVANFPSPWAGNTHEYLAKGVAVRDQYRDDPRLSFAFAPRSAWDLPESGLQEIRGLSDELDAPLQTPLNVTAAEMEQCLQRYGQRPLQRLATAGWLTPNFNALHMTQFTDEDVQTLAGTGAHVIHCPEFDFRQTGGYGAVAKLLDLGVNVALGAGGGENGDNFDMLQTMRDVTLRYANRNTGASSLPAATALRMATLNGARALGLAEHTGSLVPGKWADMIAVELNVPETQPLYNPLWQLIHAVGARQVSDVWVAGECLLRKGAFTRLDLGNVLARARNWQTRIAAAGEN